MFCKRQFVIKQKGETIHTLEGRAVVDSLKWIETKGIHVDAVMEKK